MNTPVPQLLLTADRLLTDPPAAMAAGRYRGAAFALRVAVEIAVSDILRAGPISIHGVSMRAKLLCLRHRTDAETARRVKAVWGHLCLGCHYHQYELGPTEAQVKAWRAEVGVILHLLSI